MKDDNDSITINHLRLNLNRFANLCISGEYFNTMLKLTWLYVHNQYFTYEFEDFTYKEQLKHLWYNCSYAGYNKFE